MRIATRLVLALGAVLVAVMGVYGLLEQRQRESLLGEAHLRDTEMMARLLGGGLTDAVRDGRGEDVAALLEQAREHPEVVGLALVSPSGEAVAGELPEDSDCLGPALDAARTGIADRGTVECGGRVDWAVRAGDFGRGALVVARRADALGRDVASSRRRLALVTLVLTLAGGGVIVLILRRTLSEPLGAMLTAVERFADPRFDEPVSVPEAPGELGELATAFNDLDRRLAEKRDWIIREVEERLELEGKLRRAERFATVGRITGGLAHELGSPLNVIGVRAEAILEDPDLPDRPRRHAGEIVEEVDRIGQLVRSLSHVGRSGEVRPREMDLLETVRQVLNDVERTAREAGAEIEAELPDEPMVIRGDPALLRHAVWNLVINAIQAVGEESPAGSVRIRLTADDGDSRLEVIDDGPGIPSDELSHVFEPFFTTKEVGEGTGLGLAIALGIAERHDGDLRLESGAGGGVRAELSLPMAGRGEGVTP